ncbi:MAG: EamA family transporter RarD [Anaerovoracaceae bacterium]
MNLGQKNYKLGMTAALLCSSLWGILPIYWHALIPISSSVIIFYRIFTVGIVCFLVALKLYGMERIKAPLRKKGAKLKFFLAGIIITLNWSIYIWAVNAGFVIQTSIGYYMEPLMVCVFGIVLFKEKMTRYRGFAFSCACLGVVVLLVYFKQIPAIALSLAVSFAVYAALKKSFKIESILSLLYETMFLVPFALVVIIYLEVTNQGAIGVGEPYQYGLLLCSGVMTAIPLGLFAVAANNLPLITLGITEYISPSLNLIIGIYLFNEPFDKIQLIAFAIIWVGLIVFTYGEAKLQKSTMNRGDIIER